MTKRVVVISTEKVFYHTVLEVPDDATEEEISQIFYEMDHNDKTLHETDSQDWKIFDIYEETENA